ncbi:MAG TPA: hypothetical protein VNL77_10275 [Roseiflexaceae bacterium]|nr:hypothetical protein [Roseiflexaceae bacterium]
MSFIFTVHSIFGERVLPVLIVLVAVWLAVVYRPERGVPRLARLFPALVDLQATLGIIYWVYGLATGLAGTYLGFPFVLHPLLGLISAGVAHMAVRPRGPFAALGRWAPLVALLVLLATVVGGIVLARGTPT